MQTDLNSDLKMEYKSILYCEILWSTLFGNFFGQSW